MVILNPNLTPLLKMWHQYQVEVQMMVQKSSKLSFSNGLTKCQTMLFSPPALSLKKYLAPPPKVYLDTKGLIIPKSHDQMTGFCNLTTRQLCICLLQRNKRC